MALWTPSQIPGYKHAWDASDIGSITESGGLVSQIDDQHGTEHLVQALGASQFTTNSRTLNNFNVLDGDGGDFMEKAAFPIPASGDLAIFMITIIDSVSGAPASMYSMDAVSLNDVQFDANNATQFDGRVRGRGIGAEVSLTGGPFAGPSIYNNNFDFAGAAIYNAFIDGSQQAVNTAYTTQMDTSLILRIFTNRGEGQFINGAFGEIVIVEDVTTITRQLIEGYLVWKWGIEANLPSGHPYEFHAPTIGEGVLVNQNLLLGNNLIGGKLTG